MNKRLTPQEAFELERKQELAKTVFPHDLSVEFKETLHKAMMHTSLHKCGCPEDTYINMVMFHRPFFMPEVTMMLNIIKGATPTEMGQTLMENLDMLTKVYSPVKEQWRDIDDTISNPIIARINAQLKSTQNVPIGKQIFDTTKNHMA